MSPKRVLRCASGKNRKVHTASQHRGEPAGRGTCVENVAYGQRLARFDQNTNNDFREAQYETNNGFLRIACDTCRLDRVVAFSCKRRGFCHSCGSRRMADTAAHLVDRVFPHVPVRQWVLSFPHALRYRLAYDSHLITDVLDIFIKTVFASLIRRAAEFGAVRKPQCGAVSFIQRFGSALDLKKRS